MSSKKIVRKQKRKGPLDEYAGKWVAWIASTGEVLAVGESLREIAEYVTCEGDEEFDPETAPTAIKVPAADKEPIYI